MEYPQCGTDIDPSGDLPSLEEELWADAFISLYYGRAFFIHIRAHCRISRKYHDLALCVVPRCSQDPSAVPDSSCCVGAGKSETHKTISTIAELSSFISERTAGYGGRSLIVKKPCL